MLYNTTNGRAHNNSTTCYTTNSTTCCTTYSQKFATSQHLDMSRCWALALRCGKFVVQQVVELLWACLLVVLYNMSVAGVRVVEFGTYKLRGGRLVSHITSVFGSITLLFVLRRQLLLFIFISCNIHCDESCLCSQWCFVILVGGCSSWVHLCSVPRSVKTVCKVRDQHIVMLSLSQFTVLELVPDCGQQTIATWLCQARPLCFERSSYCSLTPIVQNITKEKNISRQQFKSGL